MAGISDEEFVREARRRLGEPEAERAFREFLRRRYAPTPVEEPVNVPAPRLSPEISVGNMISIATMLVAVAIGWASTKKDVEQIREMLQGQQIQINELKATDQTRASVVNQFDQHERRISAIELVVTRVGDRLNEIAIADAQDAARFTRFEELIAEQRIREDEQRKRGEQMQDLLNRVETELNSMDKERSNVLNAPVRRADRERFE